jgi:hypothetical protein
MGAEGRTPMPEAMDGWTLLVGRTSEIRHDGRHVRTAEVEAATSDSSIMWLRFDGNHLRKLIAETDGYDIRHINRRNPAEPGWVRAVHSATAARHFCICASGLSASQ